MHKDKKLKENKKKLKLLLKKAQTPPSDFSTCISLGDQLSKERQWKPASACFESALKSQPKHFPTLMKIAYTYACSGLIIKAINTYKMCLNIQPKNHELLLNIGVMCNAIGSPSEAIDYLELALKQDKNSANGHYNLAESYWNLKQISKAELHYKQALELYRTSELNPHNLLKIGRSLRQLGNHTASINCLNEACRLAPQLPAAYLECAISYEESGNSQMASRLYRRTLELAPKHTEALSQYAELMAKQGRLDKSAWAYRRLSKLFPEDASIKHLLSAASQEGVSGVTDEHYIKDIFDDYAESFEDHLTQTLAYKTPEQLFALVEPYCTNTKLKIIDLGCGTGLCGPLFKPLADTLIGIDLSQGMLDQAERKKIYDHLILAELVSALKKVYQTQDLLIAADVLIYVGELNSIFEASQQALKNKGIFIFSVESTSGKDFKLDYSGRYQHSKDYIITLAQKHHFAVKEEQDTVLRYENSKPVMGRLYLLEKLSRD